MSNNEKNMIENSKDGIIIDGPGHEVTNDGMYFLYILFRYKLFIILTTIIATGAMVVYSLMLDNWYSSTLNVVPPKTQTSSLSGALSSINSALKDFGMTKLAKKGSGAYSFIVILESRTVKDSIIKKYNLAEKYDIDDTLMTEIRKEFDDNLDITYESDGNYLITILDKDKECAKDMVNDYLDITNGLAKKIAKKEAVKNRRYLEQRLKQTNDRLKQLSDTLQLYSNKKMVFSPEDQAAAASKAISDLKAQMITQEVLYEASKSRYGENDVNTKMLANVVSGLKQKVSDLENKPGFVGNFSLKNASKVGLEFIRLYAELETFTKVKSLLLPMLEEEKMNAVKEMPSLYIVDEAIVADKKTAPKRSYYVLGAAFGSFLFSVFFVVFFNGYRNFKIKYKSVKNRLTAK